MLYNLPIDPMALIVGFSILSVALLIVVIICIVKLNKLYRRYDMFMRGKDAETLEDTIMDKRPGEPGCDEAAFKADQVLIPEIRIRQVQRV